MERGDRQTGRWWSGWSGEDYDGMKRFARKGKICKNIGFVHQFRGRELCSEKSQGLFV